MDLADMFRRKFLDTHEKYLKSLSDVISRLYSDADICENMVDELKDQRLKERKQTKQTNGIDATYFRNIRNAWYHECAFYHSEEYEERLLFAPWKIIQGYYVIYSAISSLVRCFNEKPRLGHDAIINIYTNEFLSNNSRKNLFLPPTNFIVNQDGKFDFETYSKMIKWDYADSYHLPFIRECLCETRKQILTRKQGQKQQPVSIIHYLKELRDWVTYEDAYLFFRLYGKKVRNNIDVSMHHLILIHLVQTEHFLMEVFGLESMMEQYNMFRPELIRNLGICPEALDNRISVYTNAFV